LIGRRSPLGQLIIVSNRVSVPEKKAPAPALVGLKSRSMLRLRSGLVFGLGGAGRLPRVARYQLKRSLKTKLPS
jgi:hypothetical protein